MISRSEEIYVFGRRVSSMVPFGIAAFASLAFHVLMLAAAERAYAPYSVSAIGTYAASSSVERASLAALGG